MPVSEQAVDELHDKCGLPLDECRAALEQHGGEVDATLGAMIDAGRVTPNMLNPDSVSDALFERAANKKKKELYEKLASGDIFGELLGKMKPPGASKESNGFANAMGGLFKKLAAAKFGNKTPEELMAEDEEKK